jgi:surface protein
MGFILKVKSDNAGTSNDDQFTIPTSVTSTYNYVANWEEDGNAGNNGSQSANTGDLTITFSSAGTYLIEITGTFPHINFNDGGDAGKVLDIQFDGSIEWESFTDAFWGCGNIQNILTVGIPDLTNVTSLQHMFRSSSFNQPINDWDVSKIETLYSTFRQSDFNQDLNNWDTRRVTTMQFCFYYIQGFNGDITTWDTSSVVNMEGVVAGNYGFNQDLSGWDVGRVTDMRRLFKNSSFNQDISGWNVSNVTGMDEMFQNCPSDQDISSWDVSNVADMGEMFVDCPFDQDISSWDISSLTDASNMFDGGGLSSENYSRILIGWANRVSNNSNLPASVNFGAGTITYIDGTLAGSPYSDAPAAHAYLTGAAPNHAGTITDGGEVIGVFDLPEGNFTHNGDPIQGIDVIIKRSLKLGISQEAVEIVQTDVNGDFKGLESIEDGYDYWAEVFGTVAISGLTGTMSVSGDTLTLGVDLSGLETANGESYLIVATGGTGDTERVLIPTAGYDDKASGIVTVSYHPFGNDTTFEIHEVIGTKYTGFAPKDAAPA